MLLEERQAKATRLSCLEPKKRFEELKAMRGIDRNAILNCMSKEMVIEYETMRHEDCRDTVRKIGEVFESVGWRVEFEKRLKKENSNLPMHELDVALKIDDTVVGGSIVKFFETNDRGKWNRVMNEMAFMMMVYHLQFIMLFIGEEVYLFTENGLIEIHELPMPKNYKEFTKGNAEVFKWIDDIKTNSTKEENDLDPTEKILKMLEALQKDVVEVKDIQQEISTQIGDISEKLDGIANHLENYQALVSRQLERAEDEDEKEAIYSAFMDEMVDRLKEELKIDRAIYDYEVQDAALARKFGAMWNDGRMDEKAKKFIVSAHILFESQKSYENYLDYSGVCILMTKAVEVELKNRFYFKFLDYLKENYSPDTEINKYPTSLVYVKNNNDKVILNPNRYTMGSIPVTLCTREYGLTYAQKQNNKEKLLEFAKARLMPTKTLSEIEDILKLDGARVDYITNRFRNPSAHTNALNIDMAKECLDLLIEVEKQLIEMISDFEI